MMFSSHRGSVLIVCTVVAAFFAVIAPAVMGQRITTAKHVRQMSVPDRGTLGPAASRALNGGPLVLHPRRYERQKARLTRRAPATGGQASTAAPGPRAPTTSHNFLGLSDPFLAPPDTTGAVGTARYMETINSKFGLYTKTGTTPIGSGTLNNLVGASSADSVFDPQVIWDPTTKRFFYLADQVVSDTQNFLAFGFSKTASPTTAADFCKYNIDYGSSFPDYPKLGDSRFFTLFGVNAFNGNTFRGSDLMAISKPPAGTSCPNATTFKFADKLNLTTAGAKAFTPVPANEIDTNANGWAVARTISLPSTRLALFKVTRNSTGNPVIQGAGTTLPVPSYTVPANAPQMNSANVLDTSDTRPTQAVAGIDTARGSKFAIWTQHTIKSGAGTSQVRWYEINPATHSLMQRGTISTPSAFSFNGAISPNRAVNGAAKSGGGTMLLNFNTSSSAAFPAIRMVSKGSASAQSASVLVQSSPGPLGGFDCDLGVCRWGDYAAATPDPNPPSGSLIWSTNEYASGQVTANATSRTRNWSAKP